MVDILLMISSNIFLKETRCIGVSVNTSFRYNMQLSALFGKVTNISSIDDDMVNEYHGQPFSKFQLLCMIYWFQIVDTKNVLIEF